MSDTRARRLFIVMAVVYALAALALPNATFWSNDGGEKLLQVKELARAGVGRPAIPYDPLGVEPKGSFRFSPFVENHASPVGGRLVPIVPIYFPLASVLPYRALGPAGLVLLPWLGALLTLFFVYRVAERAFDRDTALFCLAAAGAGSSIAFYGITFWEHTLAAAACAAALFLLCDERGGLRKEPLRLAGAGFALASAAWVRGESLLLVAAMSGAFLLLKHSRRAFPFFVAGALAGLAPQWLCNSWLYGNALGPQVAGTAMLQQDSLAGFFGVMATRRWEIARGLFFDYGFGTVAGVTVAFVTIAAPLWLGRRAGSGGFRTAVCLWLAVCIAAVTAALLLFAAQPDLILATMTHTPLWVALPMLPLMFLRERSGDSERERFLQLLYVAALLTLVAFAAGLPSRGGLQWGPRYAVVFFPLLIVSAGAGYRTLGRRAPEVRVWCWGLVTIGVVAQITGGVLLFHKKDASAETLRAIRSLQGDAVLTDVWWLPEDGADLYHDLPTYGFDDAVEFLALTARLRDLGHTRLVLASRRDFRGAFEPGSGIDVAEVRELRPSRLGSFDLNLYRLDLRGAAAPSPRNRSAP